MYKPSDGPPCPTCKGKRVIVVENGRKIETVTCPQCIGSGTKSGYQTK